MINYIKHLFILILMVCLLSLPVFAQPFAGAKEITGSASYFRPIGSGSGNLNVDATFGYYLTQPWQIGIRQSYVLSHQDGPDIWNAVTAPFINYHFINVNSDKSDYVNNIVPFIGMFTGAVWNDDDFTGTVGPQAGIKVFMTKSTFLALAYRYEWFFEELKDANEVQDANHAATLGIGYLW